MSLTKKEPLSLCCVHLEESVFWNAKILSLSLSFVAIQIGDALFWNLDPLGPDRELRINAKRATPPREYVEDPVPERPEISALRSKSSVEQHAARPRLCKQRSIL